MLDRCILHGEKEPVVMLCARARYACVPSGLSNFDLSIEFVVLATYIALKGSLPSVLPFMDLQMELKHQMSKVPCSSAAAVPFVKNTCRKPLTVLALMMRQ